MAGSSNFVRPIGLVAFLTAPIWNLPQTSLADARLPRIVSPTEQSIVLKLDADELEYSGSTQINLQVDDKTSSFQFHAEGLTIDKLVLTQNAKPLSADFEMGEFGIVTVTTESMLQSNDALLEIDFSNTFDTTAISLYRMETEGRGYCFTQFEADDAREAFPCWDEPSFKIPYQLTISVPDAHIAITNMSVEKESAENGWRTYAFRKSPPMPAYLLAIATGPLEMVPIPGMSVPGNVVTVKGRAHLTSEAIKMAPPLLAALERYFGSPYPYDKLDLIAVPEFWPGGMENPGAITYAEQLLLLDPAATSISQKRGLAAVTAHEMAHMWFGDLVTMEWWDDLWLNESFASWMGDKVTHEVFPQYGMDVAAVRGASGAMVTDARPSTRAIRRPVEATDNLLQAADELAYDKGQSVLGMFEAWLGPETFRKGVIDYVTRNAWKNATATEFWAALTGASGTDFAATMATFLDQPGVPLVSAELTMDGRVKLTQKRFTSYGHEVGGELWSIPIQLKYADRNGTKTQAVLLDEPEMTVAINSDGPADWVLPNADSKGYYRWTVPPQMLAALTEKGTVALEVSERVGMLGNFSALLDAGAVSGGDFLQVLNQFADDPDPQVVSTMVSGLGKVRNAFVTPELEDEYAEYVRRTLGPALDRFGLQPRPGEDEEVARFRPQLIEWLADDGQDAAVIRYADSLAALAMNDPTAVDPSLINTVVNLAAHHGDQSMFESCKQRFETAKTPRERSLYLGTLGQFRDPTLVDAALAYALVGPLRPNEFFYIPGGVGSYPANEDRVFEWTMTNYVTITGKMPPMIAAFMPYMASGCSRERLVKAQEFFGDPSRSVAGTEETLAKVSDQVNDCAGLREREGARVAEYLKQFVASDD